MTTDIESTTSVSEVKGAESTDHSEELVHHITPAKAPPMFAKMAELNGGDIGEPVKEEPKPATEEEKKKFEVDDKGFVVRDDKGEPVAKKVEEKPVEKPVEKTTDKPVESEEEIYNPEVEELREELKAFDPFREELEYREVALQVSPMAYFIDLIQAWSATYPELKEIKGFFTEDKAGELKEIKLDIEDYVKNVKVGLKELTLQKQAKEQDRVREAEASKAQQSEWQKQIATGIDSYMKEELGEKFDDKIYAESALAVAKYIRTGENWKKEIDDIVKIVCHDIAKKYRDKPVQAKVTPEAAKAPVKSAQPSSFSDKGAQGKPKPPAKQQNMWAVAANLNAQTLRRT